MGDMIDPSPTTPAEYLEAQEKRREELPNKLFLEESSKISKKLTLSGERSFSIFAPNRDSTLAAVMDKVAEMLKEHFEKAGWEVSWHYIYSYQRYLCFHLPGTRAKGRRILKIGAAILLAGTLIGGAVAYPSVKAEFFPATANKPVAVEQSEAELAALIKRGNFDYVASSITAEHFPDSSANPMAVEANFKVYHFDRPISSEGIIKEMEKDGYRPVNLRELLAYCQNGWDGTDWVVALGQTWRDGYGDRGAPYAWGGWGGRKLCLFWCDEVWFPFCRFLAVRPAK